MLCCESVEFLVEMGSRKVTVYEVNNKVDDLTTKFTSSLMEFKKELESKFSSLPISPATEEGKNDLLLRFQTFENYFKQSLNALKSDILKLKEDVEVIQADNRGLWRRHNGSFLVVHGVVESEKNSGELYNNMMLFFNDKVLAKIEHRSGGKEMIVKRDIKQCYRMGKKSSDKPRPVAVQFCNVWIRDKLLLNKKNLKGSRTLLTELLSRDVLKLFKAVRSVNKTAWTYRGMVYIFDGNKRKLIGSIEDLPSSDRGDV